MTVRKNKEIKVRMTEQDLFDLDEKVSRTNLSREEFVRRSVQGQTVKEKPPAEYGKILYELRRIGSNLNQLLVIARTHGFVDEREVRDMAKDIQMMDAHFTDAFCKM